MTDFTAKATWPTLSTQSRILLLVAVAFIGTLQSTEAQVGAAERESLRGLPGLEVIVEPTGAEAERDGLRTADIQTDVELQLRLAGIRVLSATERRAHPAKPYLFVNVNSERSTSGGMYSFGTTVNVQQVVSTWSGQNIVATTWNVSSVGDVGASRLRELRKDIKDDVNKLINDWLAVNGK